MNAAAWTISVIAIGIVFAIVFWTMRGRHPGDAAGHRHDGADPPRRSGGVDRPAGPDAEAMAPGLRRADLERGPARSGSGPDAAPPTGQGDANFPSGT